MKKAAFKPVTYRLTNNRFGEAALMKTGRNLKLATYDEEKKVNRLIRHAPYEKSIFVDEQGDNPFVPPVIFKFGQLVIESESDLMTKAFLDKHPDNVANGGNWFEVIDEEGDNQEFVDVEEKQLDLKQLVREKSKEDDGLYELEAVVSVLKGQYIGGTMSMAELKSIIYRQIEDDYTYFMDDNDNPIIFEDDFVKMKYLAIRAVNEGIVKQDTKTRSVVWVHNKEKIFQAPAGIRVMDSFAEFLMTEDGMLVGEEIANRS